MTNLQITYIFPLRLAQKYDLKVPLGGGFIRAQLGYSNRSLDGAVVCDTLDSLQRGGSRCVTGRVHQSDNLNGGRGCQVNRSGLCRFPQPQMQPYEDPRLI